MDRERIERAYQKIKAALLAEQTSDGYWVGELSSSALATATAIGAFAMVDKRNGNVAHAAMIEKGAAWLRANRNADGGWGDTIRSKSNISTTVLCLSAFAMIGETDALGSEWMTGNFGAPDEWPEAVRSRYGKDRTFSVPILTMASLAGMVKWNEVPRLPFELACIPQRWYRYARLPVVSYALPALIAIGQCVHHHRSKWNPIARFTRWIARKRSLKVLRKIQPTSGGYLEATPLTAFVTMSLASLPRDLLADEVIAPGVKFLEESMRPDGSWPIDTNLSTWVTTLAVNAFAAADDLESLPHKDKIAHWLLDQQGKERHPYTGADPGGWAWTPLSGGVPDCDDTPGALIALKHLGVPRNEAIENGLMWLLDLQNRDGGWPTFCKGWGVLPFDRSGSDLTAHVLRAFEAWDVWSHFPKAIEKGRKYLFRKQAKNGSWLPLWFGNQDTGDDTNPVYGTARVSLYFADIDFWIRRKCGNIELSYTDEVDASNINAADYLESQQNADGGFGGGGGTESTVEETSIVLGQWFSGDHVKAIRWLVEAVERDAHLEPTPIGFYFAKLWYFEKLYPLVFALAALGKARKQ